ncbi:MAG: histidine phosphatase family protein [Chitinophagales bacterium]
MKAIKELYIVRHGQTDHNAKGIVQGKGVNLPLNEVGRQQAAAFFKAYKHIPFDIIYTSTLLRAQQTIHSFRDLGIPHESHAELDEISWGEMEGNHQVMENSNTFLNLLESWRNGDVDAKPEGGESPRELQQRQRRFVEKLLQTPHKKILISMHGRAIRALMCTLTGKPLHEMEKFQHVNLTLYKVNLYDDGHFDIELNNEQGHLKDLQTPSH